jgi:hypothetical protein
MGYEKALEIGNLLKINDFYKLSPQDQKTLLAEIDPNYQDNPAFFMNSSDFSSLSKQDKFKSMAGHMPGFENLPLGDQEDYYEEMRNKYDFERSESDKTFFGRVKNKVSDIASDVADVAKAGTKLVFDPRFNKSEEHLSELQQNLRPSEGTKRVISTVARPVLETTGAAGGAIIGSSASPAGTVVGGGLGYALGRKWADVLDQMMGLRKPGTVVDETLGSVKDVAEGATMTAGEIIPAGRISRVIGSGVAYALAGEEGDVIDQIRGKKQAGTMGQELLESGERFAEGSLFGAATEAAATVLVPIYVNGKRMFRRIPKADVTPVKKDAAEKAAEILKAHTPEGEIWTTNAQEAKSISDKMPGVEFSPAEAMDNPNMLLMEQTAVRESGDAPILMKERDAYRAGAIRQYKEQHFGGNENISNVADIAETRKKELNLDAIKKEEAIEKQIAAKKPQEAFATGEKIIAEIEKAKSPVRDKMNELEDGIADVPVTLAQTADMIQSLASRPDATAAERNSIKGLMKNIETIVGDNQITLKHARGIQRTINDKIAANSNKNPSVAYSMGKIKDAIDQDLQIGPSGPAKDAYDAFNKYASEEWFGRFKKGAVGQATAKGQQASGLKLPSESIPGLFLSDTGSRGFINSLGKQKSKEIMDSHVAYLINAKARDASGRITEKGVKSFLGRHEAALKNYGLYNDYQKLGIAAQRAEIAAKQAKDFEKNALGKVLNADPGKAVGVMLSGSNKGAKAREVMNYIGDDVAAQNGMKNAFADYIINKVETTAKNIDQSATMSPAMFERIMKEYNPALEEIYKKSPKQLEALKNIQKAVEISARSKKRQVGSASQTYEFFANNLISKATNSIAMSRAYQLNPKIAAIKDLFRHFRDTYEQNVSKLLVRSMFDGNYSKLFYDFSDGKITRRQFKKQINALNEQSYFGGAVGKIEALQKSELQWQKMTPFMAGAKVAGLEEEPQQQ